jgi:hydroxylamine dehydrogenase
VRTTVMVVVFLVLVPLSAVRAEKPRVSEATQECISCHESLHPGIVGDWRKSRHARTTPAEALEKKKIERRISAAKVPEKLAGVVVGCAECHGLNPGSHRDTFDHNEKKIHVVVSPQDCATCHPEEAEQFTKNIMSWARVNLVENKLYQSLLKAINGVQSFKNMRTTIAAPDAKTNADSCYHCHGTEIKVTGKHGKDTDYGEMEFPILSGWPNQGVGRMNPDGSKGSCTACHTRHDFSIEMARKPYTCSQCHKGPDVPAYPAYGVSKHGNLFFAMNRHWNMTAVPWTVGKDLTAPTCAVCHVSLLVDGDGDTVATRTHQMNDRLPWRVLGLIYSHPHPKSPNTSLIRNQDGQQLPTTFAGVEASEFLIGPKEMKARRERMQKVCRSCHSEDWVKGHWAVFENTIKTTNKMTHTATEIMLRAWKEGVADRTTGLFDEAMEKKWVQQWLFYGNSTRFASAMLGADYGVYAEGRWYLAKNVQELLDRLKLLIGLKKRKP